MVLWLRTVLFSQRTWVQFPAALLGGSLRASDSLLWSLWAPHACIQTTKTHNEKEKKNLKRHKQNPHKRRLSSLATSSISYTGWAVHHTHWCLLCNIFVSWAFSRHSNLNCLAFFWRGLKWNKQRCSDERRQNQKWNHAISLRVLFEVSFISDSRLLTRALWSYLVSAGNKEPFS